MKTRKSRFKVIKEDKDVTTFHRTMFTPEQALCIISMYKNSVSIRIDEINKLEKHYRGRSFPGTYFVLDKKGIKELIKALKEGLK